MKNNLMDFVKMAFFILTVIFINASLVSTVFAETNLIDNPGFENSNTELLNWTLVTNNGNIPLWDSVSHSGSKSIKISVPGTIIIPRSGYITSSSPITVSSSETYTFSAWGKTSGIAGNAIVYLAEAGDSNFIAENTIVFSNGTQNWTKKEIRFTTLPGTKSLYLVSRIESGYGNFWVDDLELTHAQPQPSITIDSPLNGENLSTPIITVNGTAMGESVISKVEIKVGSGEWKTASGTTYWNTSVNLISGLNTIYVNATDALGNFNETSVTVTYTPLQNPNLITNPGFENGSIGLLNWTLVTYNKITPLWDTLSHSGSRSVQISVPGTIIIPRSGYAIASSFINVSPSENYTFSAWGKTSGIAGNAVVYLVEAGDSIFFAEHTIIFSNETENWTKKEIRFTTLPGTNKLYLVSRIESGYGNFWVDDLELIITQPQPIVTIDSPSDGDLFSSPIITVNGTVTGENVISKVEIKVGSGEWKTASGTTYWNTSVNLTSGLNTIYVNATDAWGNFNETSVTVKYTPLKNINLIANPGFENGDTKLLNWTLATYNDNTPIWDTMSHSGSRSVQISIPGTINIPRSGSAIASSVITVSPSENYTFSAWGKTSGIAGTAVVYLVEAGDSNFIAEHTIVFSNGTQNWTKKEIHFTTLPGTKSLYLASRIESGYGNFWVDDLELIITQPQPSITINSPSNDEIFSTPIITVNGTATGENVISKVEIKIGSGEWKTASGTTYWNTSVNLTSGLNTIYVNATDVLGNFNETSVTITYTPLQNPNLIANPGFENGDTKLLNWTLVAINNNIPIWDTVSYSGLRSIKIKVTGTIPIKESGYAISSPYISALPSKQYTFSAWGKTSGVYGTAVVYLVEVGINSMSIAEHGIIFKDGTKNWTRKEITFTTLPETKSLYIVPRIESGYGNFWVDDLGLKLINFTPTPGSTPTPGLTPTPGPTSTPGLTPTPGPTSTPGLTPTPGPISTPGPTPTPGPISTPGLTPTTKKVEIGNYAYYGDGYSFQDDPRLTFDMIVSLTNMRQDPGITKVWQEPIYSGPIPQTNFAWIKSRFDLAESNKDKNWQYGSYLLLEEIFHPSVRAQWKPLVEGLDTWDIEGSATFAGVTIMHIKPWYIQEYGSWDQTWWDSVKADNNYNDPRVMEWSAYFGYNLYKAWNQHMHNIGKKSAIIGITGIPAEGPSGMNQFEMWFYPLPMWQYITANYDLIFSYQYPTCISCAYTDTQRPVSASVDVVKQLREKYNYKGKIVHILTSVWPDGFGTDSETVQFEEFKAVYPYVDSIIGTSYTNIEVGTENYMKEPYPPKLIKFYNSINP